MYTRLRYSAIVYALQAGNDFSFNHPAMVAYGQESWPGEEYPFGSNQHPLLSTTCSRRHRFRAALSLYAIVNGELQTNGLTVVAEDDIFQVINEIHNANSTHLGITKTWQLIQIQYEGITRAHVIKCINKCNCYLETKSAQTDAPHSNSIRVCRTPQKVTETEVITTGLGTATPEVSSSSVNTWTPKIPKSNKRTPVVVDYTTADNDIQSSTSVKYFRIEEAVHWSKKSQWSKQTKLIPLTSAPAIPNPVVGKSHFCMCSSTHCDSIKCRCQKRGITCNENCLCIKLNKGCSNKKLYSSTGQQRNLYAEAHLSASHLNESSQQHCGEPSQPNSVIENIPFCKCSTSHCQGGKCRCHKKGNPCNENCLCIKLHNRCSNNKLSSSSNEPSRQHHNKLRLILPKEPYPPHCVEPFQLNSVIGNVPFCKCATSLCDGGKCKCRKKGILCTENCLCIKLHNVCSNKTISSSAGQQRNLYAQAHVLPSHPNEPSQQHGDEPRLIQSTEPYPPHCGEPSQELYSVIGNVPFCKCSTRLCDGGKCKCRKKGILCTENCLCIKLHNKCSNNTISSSTGPQEKLFSQAHIPPSYPNESSPQHRVEPCAIQLKEPSSTEWDEQSSPDSDESWYPGIDLKTPLKKAKSKDPKGTPLKLRQGPSVLIPVPSTVPVIHTGNASEYSTCYMAGILQVLEHLAPVQALVTAILKEPHPEMPRVLQEFASLLQSSQIYMDNPNDSNLNCVEIRVATLLSVLRCGNASRNIREYNDAGEFMDKFLNEMVKSVPECERLDLEVIRIQLIDVLELFSPQITHLEDVSEDNMLETSSDMSECPLDDAVHTGMDHMYAKMAWEGDVAENETL